jgi:hypothetical protein
MATNVSEHNRQVILRIEREAEAICGLNAGLLNVEVGRMHSYDFVLKGYTK